MARIRSVKPEICESETMARCSAEVERTFVRLWTHLDDHGRAKDHPTLIKAALFPLHDEVTAALVDEHLWTLAAEGLIVRYEVDGKRFIACPSWGEHQHPQKPRASKFPAPDDGEIRPKPTPDDTPTVPVPDAYGPVVEGVEVVVGVVVGEPPSGSSPVPGTGLALVANDPAPASPSQRYTAEFETWWAEYPRKVEKAPAAKAYAAARRTTSAEHLLEAVRDHAHAWATAGTETNFILYPERWLKRRRYDEPPEAQAPSPRTLGRTGTNAEKIRRSVERMTGGTP